MPLEDFTEEGWTNYGELSNGLPKKQENCGNLKLGLTMDDVIDIMGGASRIFLNTWYYGKSEITFDSHGKVYNWYNTGNLAVVNNSTKP